MTAFAKLSCSRCSELLSLCICLASSAQTAAFCSKGGAAAALATFCDNFHQHSHLILLQPLASQKPANPRFMLSQASMMVMFAVCHGQDV